MTTTKTSTLVAPAKKASEGNSTSSLSGKKTKTLEQLFEDGLKDIYSAEQQLLEALPKMAEAADSEELQDAIMHHLAETKRHVQRLEKVMEKHQFQKTEEKCLAMEGLIKENQRIIDEYDRSPVRDSALIIGAQKIEHYEIASYGSLCELADVLGYHKANDILGRTLDEEENTDRELSSIAQDVNDEAYEQSLKNIDQSGQRAEGEEEDEDY